MLLASLALCVTAILTVLHINLFVLMKDPKHNVLEGDLCWFNSSFLISTLSQKKKISRFNLDACVQLYFAFLSLYECQGTKQLI